MIVRLLVRRLLFLVLVLFGLSVMTFGLAQQVPGDPARRIAGPRAPKSAVEKIRADWGFEEPVVVQYVRFVEHAIRLDFGRSIATRQLVRDDLKDKLPATIELGLYAFILSTVIGIPLGVLSAVKRDSLADHVARFISISGLALPAFWMALMAQYFFFGKLGWLPDGQRLPIGVEPPRTITSLYAVDALLTGNWSVFRLSVEHLLLPVVVLAYGSLAVVTRMVRGGMLEVLNQDYIRTARAKGLSNQRVVGRHALKNALLPTVTSLGLQIGLLLSGTFLVEIVFSWDGLGRYAVDAILAVDYNATMATTLIVGFIFVVVNLLVDVLYLVLDPRISYT
jgi:peptide/nickel transport system permease protein